MNSIFDKRIETLGTETSFEVLAKARALEKQGRNIIHLEIGEPDFDTPDNIKDAAVRALNSGYTHYVPVAGIAEFRETIAHYISRTRGIQVEPEEVVVTPGAKPIMFYTVLALVGEGEEVMYPNPGFPTYESLINFVGAKPIPIQLKEENDFRLDPEFIKENVTRKTKLIILNSPENPTGGVLTKDDLKVIADCIKGRDDVIILADEIYSRIIYEGKHESIAALPGMKDKTILLDGFSKTYAMTGWRLGYGVMRKDIAQKMVQLMTNSTSCTSAFTQMAGIEALEGPQSKPEEMVEEFRKRREAIVSGLNRINELTCKMPHGAFYAFPNITRTGMTSKEFADRMLNVAGVAMLSGTSFGKYGEGHVRMSFANSIENINKALERIAKALELKDQA